MKRPRVSSPPSDDPSIDALAADLREAISGHWSHRSRAEHTVAEAFASLRPRLAAIGAAAPVLALADKAIDDERRHGDLCARLASRYAGREIAPSRPEARALPDFGTGDEPTEVALLVMGMCCINESIASEWIRSCWSVASARTAVFANREHLRDEVDHARLGWAHLASSVVDDALLATLRPWVPKLVAVNVAEWKKPDPHLPPEGIPAHGHLSAVETEAVIDAAVRDVVLPGFALVGLGPRAR